MAERSNYKPLKTLLKAAQHGGSIYAWDIPGKSVVSAMEKTSNQLENI